MISSNSEAFASELLQNLEDMLPLYYMHSDVCSGIKSSNKRVSPVAKEVTVLYYKTTMINSVLDIKI